MRRVFLISSLVLSAALAWAQNVLLQEDFESASGKIPPSSWTLDILSGSVSLDSFIFQDSLYHLAPWINGQYALFDSYNGGSLGATNSNGIGEEVALVSTPLSTKNLNSLYLSFDYHLTSFSGAGLYADVSTDGNNWTNVFARSTSTSGTSFTSINLNAYINADSFQLRLRWLNASNTNNQGYGAFDNVRLVERVDNDLSVDRMSLASPLACALQSHNISLYVRNEGLKSQSNVPVSLVLSGLINQTLRDTLINISANSEIEVNFGQFYLAQDGILRAEAEVFLASDSITSNNGLLDSLITSDTPSTPKGNGAVRCGTGRLVLKASSEPTETSYWFDQAAGGSFLERGDSFISPIISSSQSYFVENVAEVNKQVSTFQGPWRYNGSPTGGSYFTVKANRTILIDSLFQHCAYSANNVVVTVYSKAGSYSGFERNSAAWTEVYKDTISSPGWGKYIAMDIQDQLLYASDQQSFYISVNGSASPTFKQEVFDLEYNDLDLVAEGINNIEFGSVLSGYSWDGKVHYKNLCSSARVKVDAEIKQRPKGAKLLATAVQNGRIGSGSSTNPDITSVGSAIEFKVQPPQNQSWADYGSSWSIQWVSIESTAGVNIPSGDTSWSLDSSSAQLIYTPQASWEDSSLVLKLSLLSASTGCDTVLIRHIFVAPKPEVQFSAEDVCFGQFNQFKNNSSISAGFNSYKWYFGNGDSSDQVNPIYQYDQHGVYRVVLLATSDLGVTDSFWSNITVNEIPKVGFDIFNACEGESLKFTNRSTIDQGSINYLWTFGDGDSSVLEQPMHKYANAGVYSVKLKAEYQGCEASVVKQAYQFAVPSAAFSNTGNCQLDLIEFSNTSTIQDNAGIGASWFIEGKRLSGQKVNYSFNSSGTKDIRLIAVSQFGCADTLDAEIQIKRSPIVQMGWDKTCDKSPTQFSIIELNPGADSISYSWEFGDGASSILKEPLHQYPSEGEYDLTLTTLSTNGCTDERKVTIFIGREPIADFDMQSGCSGEGVQFVNKTRNTFGSIDFQWRFGDGQESNLYAPVHTYQVNQTTIYNVNLRVSSSNGCFSEFNKSIQIGVTPNCAFSIEQSDEDRQLFKFTPQVESYAKYTWLFEGDGVSFETSPEHRFTYPEWDYKVSLIAETEEGCKCNENSQVLTTSWTLSTKNLELEGLNLYPNPATDQVHLVLNGQRKMYQITVYTAQGRLAKDFGEIELSQDEVSLNLSDLSAGVYFVKLNAFEEQAIQQIIVY